MAGQVNIGGTSGSAQLVGNDSYSTDRTFTFPDADGELLIADSNGDVAITGDLEVAGDLQTQSINGGQIAFRNKLLNGDFSCWQRGVQVYTTPMEYTADRWKLSGDGGSVFRSSIPALGCYAMQCSARSDILQGVEIHNYGTGSLPGPFTNGSTWTFSLVSSTDPRDENLTEGCSVNFVGEVGNPSMIPAGTNFTFADLGEIVPGFNKYAITFQIENADTINQYTLGLQIGLSLSSGTIFSLCQLEAGPIATPYEDRQNLELLLCQRYYQPGIKYMLDTATDPTSNVRLSVNWTPMRATPQVVIADQSISITSVSMDASLNYRSGDVRGTSSSGGTGHRTLGGYLYLDADF